MTHAHSQPLISRAPVRLQRTASVRLRNVDLTLELEQLAWYVHAVNGQGARRAARVNTAS